MFVRNAEGVVPNWLYLAVDVVARPRGACGCTRHAKLQEGVVTALLTARPRDWTDWTRHVQTLSSDTVWNRDAMRLGEMERRILQNRRLQVRFLSRLPSQIQNSSGSSPNLLEPLSCFCLVWPQI
jgi:hypothetical protein